MKDNYKILFRAGFQEKLIDLAVKKAGSQRKLSKILNIPKGRMNDYKKEINLLPMERLRKILAFLNLDEYDISENITERIPQYWGQIVGGRHFSKKLSPEELHNYLHYVRSFKVKRIYPFKLPLDKEFCEFFGILMGDGCITEYKDKENTRRCDIIITGDKRYEKEYYQYIQEYLLRRFRINCYIYKYKNINVIRLIIRNVGFASYLLKLGFPKGKKYEKLKIPEIFLNLPWNKKKYLIRGLIDTDGSIFGNKKENYRYPYISFTTKSVELRNQVYSLLRAQEYPVYLNGNYNIFLKGIKNVQRWMNDVGTSNSKHKFKYEHWLKHKTLPTGIHGPVV